jgi:hypothetical protein
VLFLTALVIAAVGIPAMLLAGLISDAAGGRGLLFIFLAALVGGLLLLYSRFVLAPVGLIVDGRRGVAALRRSWDLTRGRVWPVFGTILLVFLMAAVVSLAIALPVEAGLAAADGAWVVGVLLGVVASAVTLPFTTIATLMIYLDLRARREAVDPATLASDLPADG